MAEDKAASTQSAAPATRDAFGELRSRMDKLFDDFTNGSLAETFPRMFGSSGGAVSPQTDIKETEKEVVVTSELPGMAENDVSVTLEDGVLTLKGEKKSETKKETDNYRMVERRFGSFERSFRLPDAIDESKVNAKFSNGVLTVTIGMKANAQRAPKKIKISSE